MNKYNNIANIYIYKPAVLEIVFYYYSSFTCRRHNVTCTSDRSSKKEIILRQINDTLSYWLLFIYCLYLICIT